MLLTCSFLKLSEENLNITKIMENYLKCLGISYLCKYAGLN